MLVFKHPVFFLLLSALFVLPLLRRRGIMAPLSLPLTLADWGRSAFRYRRGVLRFLSSLGSFLFALAFVCTVIALAEPGIARNERVYTGKSGEILFVIDVSPSMAARDMGVSSDTRLDAAKQAIRLLTRRNTAKGSPFASKTSPDTEADLGGVAYGLVTLASEAVLIFPPSMDHEAFVEALDRAAVGTLGDGTALGSGLSVALYHASRNEGNLKTAIVLLTDGENNAGTVHPVPVARLAAADGVSVYVVGIGTRGTVPLSYRDPASGEVYRGFLDSRFDEDALKAVSDAGGGAYFGVQNVDALETALRAIGRRTAVTVRSRDRLEVEGLHAVFLRLSLAAVALAYVIRRLILREVL